MTELDGHAIAVVNAAAGVNDLVAIMDAVGAIVYVNPYGLSVFGATSMDELRGRSLVELVHPDDLNNVIVAMARMLDTEAQVPGRPALVRIRRMDGTYVRIEANGAMGDPDRGTVVVIARPTTDADLHERFMALLTTGAPSEKSFELVPELGLWRQANLLHAVFVRDDDGLPTAFGSPALLGLGGLDDPSSPWAEVQVGLPDLLAPEDALPPAARVAAEALGVTWVRGRAVPDSLHRSTAVVVIGHHRSSPLPAERGTLEFAWFAMDKMAAVLEMALTWRAQAVELRRAAATDPLTGLANRAGLWAHQRRLLEGGARSVGVLCIDLDEFKPVNDTHGHGVGDALLVEVADRLRHEVRAGDLVARIGGDEFAVVMTDRSDDELDGIATRIVERMREPFTIGGHELRIGASVGLASATRDRAVVREVGEVDDRDGSGAFDADELLAAADAALLVAKHSGRGRWHRPR